MGMSSRHVDPSLPSTFNPVFGGVSDETLGDVEEFPLERRSRVRCEPIWSDSGDFEETLDEIEPADVRTVGETVPPKPREKLNPDVFFANTADFPRCNYPSSPTYAVSSRFMSDYNFPAGYEIRSPSGEERIYNRPEGVWIFVVGFGSPRILFTSKS